MVLSDAEPLEELDNLIKDIRVKEYDIFSPSGYILVLAENLTVRNVRERITDLAGPRVLNQIRLTTIEDLATEILSACTGRLVGTLPDEIRRVILIDALRELAKADPHCLASRIWAIVRNDRQENHEVTKRLDAEFEEFLRCVNAPPYDGKCEQAFFELRDLAASIPDPFVRDGIIDALHLYRDLLLKLSDKKKVLEIRDYISRTQAVREATDSIAGDMPGVLRTFPPGTCLWVSGLSVFDANGLSLLLELADALGNIRINAGAMTLDRLEKRLKSFEAGKLSITRIKGSLETGERTKVRIEAPDMRRELEAVAARVVKLRVEGIAPSETIVIARDISQYLPYIDSVMQEYGLSYHVQTRRSRALTPGYQLIYSLLDLLVRVDKDEEIPARSITNPLHLGFNNKAQILRDSSSSKIEKQVDIIGERKSWRWPEWKARLEPQSGTEIEEVVAWVDQVKGEPSLEHLKQACDLFSRSCAEWTSPLKLTTGFSSDRFTICEPHLSAHADWLEKLSGRIDMYLTLSARLRQQEKSVSWEVLKDGFLAVTSTDTYGVQLWDGEAIRFVDAGISHYLKGKVRVIMGLHVEGFPRSPPKPLLLADKFRSLVNKQYSLQYLRDPITDYENERDFFKAAIGPKGCRLIMTMPYLDERGHREDWSIFAWKGSTPDRIGVYETTSPEDRIAVPRTYMRGLARSIREGSGRVEAFEREVDTAWKEVTQKEITPRLKALDCSAVSRQPEPVEVEDEPYLAGLIESLKRKPIPAHELELYGECPVAYYYYQCIYRFGRYVQGGEKCRYEFDPDGGRDLRDGPIPVPLRWKFISTEMELYIYMILAKYPDCLALKTNFAEITRSIKESMQLSESVKKQLLDIMDHVLKDASPDSRVILIPAGVSKKQPELWRPGYIQYIDKTFCACRAYYAPRGTKTGKTESAVLQNLDGVRLVSLQDGEYAGLEARDVRRLIEDLRSLKLYLPDQPKNKCDRCVYKRLCSGWRPE